MDVLKSDCDTHPTTAFPHVHCHRCQTTLLNYIAAVTVEVKRLEACESTAATDKTFAHVVLAERNKAWLEIERLKRVHLTYANGSELTINGLEADLVRASQQQSSAEGYNIGLRDGQGALHPHHEEMGELRDELRNYKEGAVTTINGIDAARDQTNIENQRLKDKLQEMTGFSKKNKEQLQEMTGRKLVLQKRNGELKVENARLIDKLRGVSKELRQANEQLEGCIGRNQTLQSRNGELTVRVGELNAEARKSSERHDLTKAQKSRLAARCADRIKEVKRLQGLLMVFTKSADDFVVITNLSTSEQDDTLSERWRVAVMEKAEKLANRVSELETQVRTQQPAHMGRVTLYEHKLTNGNYSWAVAGQVTPNNLTGRAIVNAKIEMYTYKGN